MGDCRAASMAALKVSNREVPPGPDFGWYGRFLDSSHHLVCLASEALTRNANEATVLTASVP
jgi:hypothetical protein